MSNNHQQLPNKFDNTLQRLTGSSKFSYLGRKGIRIHDWRPVEAEENKWGNKVILNRC